MKTKDKIIEKELKKIIVDIVATFIQGGNLPDIIELRMPRIRTLLSLQTQEIVEEIEKELTKVLKVSKTADDYHIGIAYVIDTFLNP